ncbi:hypothetical protein [Pyrolobus fumarii]|nr:hypothetical protein [Pyrolobus fumarii]
MPALHLELDVNNATLSVLVYSDGSAQYVYHLDAILKGLENITGGLRLLYESKTVAEPDSLEHSSLLNITIPAILLNTSAGNASSEKSGSTVLDVRGEFRLGPGLTTTGNGTLVLNDTSLRLNYDILLNETVAVLKASLEPSNTNPDAFKRAVDAICESLKNITGELEWLTLRECSVSSGQARVSLEASVNNMLSDFMMRGLSSTDVANLLKLLEGEYNVTGSYSLRLATRSTNSHIRVELAAGLNATGDIDALMLDYARAKTAITKITIILLSVFGGALGAQVPATTAMFISTPLLAGKPPYTSLTRVAIEGTDDAIRVTIDYRSPRLIYAYPSGDPVADAKKTLGQLARSFRELRTTLDILSMLVDGASKALPETVILKPGDERVRVKPSVTPLEELDKAQIEVVAAGESSTSTTAKPSATGKPTHTSTASTTVPAEEAGGGLDVKTIILVAALAAIAGFVTSLLITRRR